MRSIVFRYDDISALAIALDETRGSLPLPRGETVLDGEWVLALFEIGSRKRATATAARGVRAAGDPHIEFERRDWDRLQAFVAARSEGPRSVRAVPCAKPRNPGEDGHAGHASQPIESSRVPSGARILLVGANAEEGASLRAMLTEIGLHVEVVGSTEHASVRLHEAQFDAVILDWHGEGGDPLELVRAMRKTPSLPPLPVLLLSARTSSREVVDAFASGADDFLPKPFRAPELGARVFGLLRRTPLCNKTKGEEHP